jgi:serine/threonine protein kinase
MDNIVDCTRFENIKVIPGNGYSPYTGYTVFRAWDNKLKRNVVVKYGKEPKNMHRTLYEEWLLISNLNHIGIIKVWDWNIYSINSYIVMSDHTLGGRRSRWREIFKTMNTASCRTFVRSMLHTLFYLQTQRILNEDVEMANIVATDPAFPIMIDFGRARKQVYSIGQLIEMLHPHNNTRANAWIRELCGIGGKYAEEGQMVNFDIEKLIIKELEEYNEYKTN